MVGTKKSRNLSISALGSGGGNRTARPSGYEPDELPTALPRDIGLQIYGHFLKPQIYFAISVQKWQKSVVLCFSK